LSNCAQKCKIFGRQFRQLQLLLEASKCLDWIFQDDSAIFIKIYILKWRKNYDGTELNPENGISIENI
jgi:hypothetical protein